MAKMSVPLSEFITAANLIMFLDESLGKQIQTRLDLFLYPFKCNVLYVLMLYVMYFVFE